MRMKQEIMNGNNPHKRAFTLIELLVVIASLQY